MIRLLIYAYIFVRLQCNFTTDDYTTYSDNYIVTDHQRQPRKDFLPHFIKDLFYFYLVLLHGGSRNLKQGRGVCRRFPGDKFSHKGIHLDLCLDY